MSETDFKSKDLSNPYVRRLQAHNLQWDAENRQKSLNTVYDYTVDEVQDTIAWYVKNIRGKRRWGWWLRVAAVFFAGLGTIYPIMIELIFFEGFLSVFNSPIWATVFLSFGAGALAVDRIFGFSNAWMRYMKTQMLLECKLDDFEYLWEMESIKAQGEIPTNEQVQARVAQCATFRREVAKIVEEETSVWVQEFQSAMQSLNDSLQSQRDRQRPGALNIRVENGDTYELWTLYLNGRRQNSFKGSSAALTDLAPDFYSVRVEGMYNGEAHQVESVVTINAGEAASLTLQLPPAV